DDAAEVLPRLRPADRQEDARARRVRDRLGPARRLREDPGDEPAVAGRPDGDAEPGGAREAPGRAGPPRRRARARGLARGGGGDRAAATRPWGDTCLAGAR